MRRCWSGSGGGEPAEGIRRCSGGEGVAGGRKPLCGRMHETLQQKHLAASATLPLLAWPCIDERGWSLGDAVRACSA